MVHFYETFANGIWKFCGIIAVSVGKKDNLSIKMYKFCKSFEKFPL